MSGLFWDLCSLVLEEKRLLPPLDVETDLGSTSVQGTNPDAEVLQYSLWETLVSDLQL